jgi:branched-chain amino acid transport system ATP-binding protein
MVEEVFSIIDRLNTSEGLTVLLAEQNTRIALEHASYGYVLESGRVVMDGTSRELMENTDVREFYLGVGGPGRKSFRDAKSYRRRKRWLA